MLMAKQRVGVFRSRYLNAEVEARQRKLVEYTDCSWVHTAMLAWQRHYLATHPKYRQWVLKRHVGLFKPPPSSQKRRRARKP